MIQGETLELRLTVDLPAAGRTIQGMEAVSIFFEDLPKVIQQGVFQFPNMGLTVKHFVDAHEDQEWLRTALDEKGLVAFVPEGAILPRESGVSSRPLVMGSVPFYPPQELSVTFQLPHKGMINGLGLSKGVTLIVGGGFHGKSTLLRALELGIYSHIPGDGREYVATDPNAVKIRAEDGRFVEKVNISPFIKSLPLLRDTLRFSTDNASGSTSQAANIMEALEMGAKVLLIDEDTSATNFMIRDRRMQELVQKAHEPITPFIDKVRQLYQDRGVSTILVMGGSGDYFEAADTVIWMNNYRPFGVTEQARTDRRKISGPSSGRRRQMGLEKSPAAGPSRKALIPVGGIGRSGSMPKVWRLWSTGNNSSICFFWNSWWKPDRPGPSAGSFTFMRPNIWRAIPVSRKVWKRRWPRSTKKVWMF